MTPRSSTVAERPRGWLMLPMIEETPKLRKRRRVRVTMSYEMGDWEVDVERSLVEMLGQGNREGCTSTLNSRS